MHIPDNWCNVEPRYSLLHLNWLPVLIWTVITNSNRNPNPVLTVQISPGNFTVQILTAQILSGYHLKHLQIPMDGDGGGGHWLVRMEWRPARWSVCLPLLIFRCTISPEVLFWHQLTRVVPEKGP